jgi:hypothetical protein
MDSIIDGQRKFILDKVLPGLTTGRMIVLVLMQAGKEN